MGHKGLEDPVIVLYQCWMLVILRKVASQFSNSFSTTSPQSIEMSTFDCLSHLVLLGISCLIVQEGPTMAQVLSG